MSKGRQKDAGTEGPISVSEKVGGAWLDPGLVLLRKKVEENWTGEHRSAARKIFLEGGWTQKRLSDIGWVGYQSMSSLPGGGRHREAQAVPLPRMVPGEERYQRLSESGSKKREPQKRSGSGKEVLSRILSVRANGTVAFSA